MQAYNKLPLRLFFYGRFCYNRSMKNITRELIFIIILTFLATVMFLGATILYQGSTLLEEESKSHILAATEDQAGELSTRFSHIQGLVDSLTGTVRATFDTNAMDRDERYVEDYNQGLKDIIRNNLSANQLAHGLYVTYNPDYTGQNDEVWYARTERKIKAVRADFGANGRDFTLPYEEDMAYFFKPQEVGEGAWTGPYHDRDVKIDVITYSRSINVAGHFVGVAGADITTDATLDLVKSLKLYPHGYAFLLDENRKPIIAPTDKEALKHVSAEGGVAEFLGNEERMIMAFTPLSNGWLLGTVQPRDIVFKTISKLRTVFFILFLIALAVIIVLANWFSRAFSRPIEERQARLEQENLEKDVLLIYQARQAKVGEMMANITHQWKQPLNSIHLIIGNLLDAYDYQALDKETLTAAADKIETITRTMARTITDFTEFLKPPMEESAFDVKRCVKTALALMEESLSSNAITVKLDLAEPCHAYGNANEFSHVLFNIFNNARDAILDSPSAERYIAVSACVREKDGREMTCLEVSNEGRQLDEEQLKQAFDRYYTTKPRDEGTGLGLYISRLIVEQRMHGFIHLGNWEKGVRCDIEIPSEETALEENSHE